MAKQELSTAIIIPVKSFNQRLNKCITECLKLDYSNFKIFVFPDQPFFEFKGKIEVIPTGNIGPALKRDLALKHSQAEIFAFLDDDAYPDKNWLKNALRHFQDKDTAGVGGPALTPDESPVMEKASGYVFSSVLASGKYIYRYVPKETQEVDDYPSCNFLVRREIFDRLGGFNNNFWPGEDTKLCLDITKKLGKKIIYDPQAFVFHHRRTLFFPHYKQVANYALHRGYFVKKFPETSLRFAYFLPSILLIYFVFGLVMTLFVQSLSFLYYFSMIVYVLLVFIWTFIEIIKEKKIDSNLEKYKIIFLVTAGIIMTHFTYGLFFVRGLLSGSLDHK